MSALRFGGLCVAVAAMAAFAVPAEAVAGGWGRYRSVTSYSFPSSPSVTYRERVTYRPAVVAGPVVVGGVVPAVAYMPNAGYSPAYNAYAPVAYGAPVPQYAPVAPVYGYGVTGVTVARPVVRSSYYAPAVVPGYAPYVQPVITQPYFYGP